MLFAGLLLIAARASAADRQIRPFVGATFGGGTTFVDPEEAIGKPHLAIGVSAVFLGEILGTEIDVFDAPGFFESGDRNLVHVSHVATFSGNLVLAAPRRLTEYFLRPYIVAAEYCSPGTRDSSTAASVAERGRAFRFDRRSTWAAGSWRS